MYDYEHGAATMSNDSPASHVGEWNPSWEAMVTPMPLDGAPRADDATRRWDTSGVRAWTGTYWEDLTAKVSRVFPSLFGQVL